MPSRLQLGVFLLAAIAAASMWFYVGRVLVPYQIADAAANGRPRGNLSDLYPRWLGARELLVHGRNPYRDDITREIQQGYYGRVLDPARPNDPKDQQGFAYPAYVVFLLAPLVHLDFATLLVPFYWLLAIVTALSVWLWVRVLRWKPGRLTIATCILLTLGSFPAAQGIKLQQLSLLVSVFFAGAAACLASGWLVSSGILLALSTIKPQLAWPLIAWLMFWAVSDWRARRRLLIGFASTMAILLVGSELLLPGWWRMFAEAIDRYHRYTQNQSVLQVLIEQAFGLAAGTTVARVSAEILSALSVIACGFVLWNSRKIQANSTGFGYAVALVLALTVLVVPMSAPYNQVLLVPAILLLVRDRKKFFSGPLLYRFSYWVGVGIVCWQWAASCYLAAVALALSPMRAFHGWQWPLFASLILPVWVFGLTVICLRRTLGWSALSSSD